MNLRPHQAQMQRLCQEILAGAKIKKIIAAVTPGGGKSALPVIAASILIPGVADRLVWVVPRNSLKWQGEAEFVDPRWDTSIRLRACHGNDADPDRGHQGYLTTYQAIGTSAVSHQGYVAKHRTILFLDEPHHVADDAAWSEALAPMIDAAVLVVFASGTFSRADGHPIHGLEYIDGFVNLHNTPDTRVIRYGRAKAIADGATLPVELKTFDGEASWISREGIKREVSSLHHAGDDRADAVFTALRTDFAFGLLAMALSHWDLVTEEYPAAKLLVVAPDIETAKLYHSRLAPICLTEIATSEDSTRAHKIIDAYRAGSIPALVTVGMAYEGLSVPEITHIACLTQIRSVPWLEQMQARGNRRAPGKSGAWVFAPADRMILKAWRMIEEESLIPLDQGAESEPQEEKRATGSAEESGWQAPQIKPLWSSAHGVNSELPQAPVVAPSVAEGVLRDNIRAIRRRVVDEARPGSQKALASMFNHYVREVADKSLDDMTAVELESVWMMLRDKFKGRL